MTSKEAYIALHSIKIRKELAPVVADLYNVSLRHGYLPTVLKCAIVCPLPKQRPAVSVENDIRPISLTSQIAKVMEGFTAVRIVPQILRQLDPRQFATGGKSSSHAATFILHLLLDALDKWNCAGRLFFADFRKGFDLIDHRILMRKLAKYNIHNSLLRWVACFLYNRSQFV